MEIKYSNLFVLSAIAGDQAYATAWLANDSAQVMATLTTDAVIVPSGMPVFEGQNAIREFWWPKDSPSTKVTEFTLVQHEVGGQGDLGFVRGSFSLAFDYDGKSYTSGGEYFSLLGAVAMVRGGYRTACGATGP